MHFHCNHSKYLVSIQSWPGILPLMAAIEHGLWRKHRLVNQAKTKQLLESNNQCPRTNNKFWVAAREKEEWWEMGSY